MAGHQAPADPPSVLLAEHEPEVAEMAARYLRRDGLRVRLVSHPDQTLAELTAGPDVAAVIDLTMPGLDPRRIRRALRTPVIFLVADLKRPRPRGLAPRGDVAGARRWLARPFSPRQLVALVRDVLAPAAPSGAAPAVRSAAGLRLDGHSRTLVAGGHRVSLTATEYALLAALMDHPGRVLSRRQLLAAAGRRPLATGPRTCTSPSSGPRSPRPRLIRTVRGSGYLLEP